MSKLKQLIKKYEDALEKEERLHERYRRKEAWEMVSICDSQEVVYRQVLKDLQILQKEELDENENLREELRILKRTYNQLFDAYKKLEEEAGDENNR